MTVANVASLVVQHLYADCDRRPLPDLSPSPAAQQRTRLFWQIGDRIYDLDLLIPQAAIELSQSKPIDDTRTD